MYKSVSYDPEARAKKISEKLKGNKNGSGNKGKKGKIPWNKGKKMSSEAKEKMMVTKIGKRGKLSNAWKGENAGYSGKHKWVIKIKGKAIECIICGDKTNRINWANVNHKYSRNLEDYISLCPVCHARYDRDHNGRKEIDYNHKCENCKKEIHVMKCHEYLKRHFCNRDCWKKWKAINNFYN